jgi:putative acetyltransferase
MAAQRDTKILAVSFQLKSNEILIASSQDIPAIQTLWREYWDSLGFAPSFQNFEEELRTLPGVYAPPKGRLLVAMVDGEHAGTAALRPLNVQACEAKRLYVQPRHRVKGVGKGLLYRLIAEARAAGYSEMYADTMQSMTSAVNMYKQLGFLDSAPYSTDPTPGALYLRLTL